MKKHDKEKLVKVEFSQQSPNSFLSLRMLIPMHEAGQIMTFIGGIKNKVPLKPKKQPKPKQ